jgi:hypothetical protein
MNQVYSLTIFFILLTFFIGCTTTAPIDTYNKKAAAFEISYNEVLKTAKLYLNDSNVSPDVKTKIKDSIKTVAKARKAMLFAEGAGDITTAQGQLKTAQSALAVLRKIVEENQ